MKAAVTDEQIKKISCEFVNSGRCGLYGRGLEYTYFGYKKCEECKLKNRNGADVDI